ncbi:GNAT family N-acetyltransferase [Flexivirga sp. ID2601S]|uniref:GNAT family N-acetyltransferase n=1 Tax=Flexivirga aerilata TaxID=1656889 RepID=A0A849AX10_9MICO|nr:GNAT family N-acetyltransferase [Flexivirga aerilata]NNG41202.1 GNAT family N-acetyltransferase [Flexivirga aerilata]
MARSAVQVARVSPGDEERFAALWVESRAAQGLSADHAERAIREGRLRVSCQREDVRIYLATIDEEPVGFTVVMHGPVSALNDDIAVWIDLLWVKPGRRQRGVAKALLAMVASYAEHLGASDIVSCVPATSRDANRFFARLGFASVVTERTTTAAALRRRLAGSHQGPSVSEAVRRRRSLRARSRTRVAMASSSAE